MIWEQPLGIAAIPNNRYLGVRDMSEGDVELEEVYTGEFLILALDSNSILRGKVLDYEELEIGNFQPFKLHGFEEDIHTDDNEYMGIVNHITTGKIKKWIKTNEYLECENPIKYVLDAIYSHVYKNLNIDNDAKAYLEALKKQINYKDGNG